MCGLFQCLQRILSYTTYRPTGCSGTTGSKPDSFRAQLPTGNSPDALLPRPFPRFRFSGLGKRVLPHPRSFLFGPRTIGAKRRFDPELSERNSRVPRAKFKKTAKLFLIPDRSLANPPPLPRFNRHLTDKYDNKCNKCL